MFASPVPPASIGGRAVAIPPDFACSWTNAGADAAWVHAAGELDISTAPELKQILHESQLQARLVVLDLRELTFMDTAGAHVIVNACRHARRVVCRLIVLRGPPHVDRLFTLTGSFHDLEIIDLDPAESSFQALLRLTVEDLAS